MDVSMNILLVNFKEGKQKELDEFLNTQGYKVYFADTDLEAVQILNNTNISDVIVHLTKILNIGLINYINHHYSDLRVLLVTNNYVEQAISIIKNSACEILHEPFTLAEFKKILQN
jgi:DNA-binding NtrC family response regulator